MHEVDSIGVGILVLCIHQATKNDGEIKLASMLAHAAVVFELARIERFFET